MLTTLKNGRKPVKLQKESPAGCAGEGKQSKKNRRWEKDGLKINDNIIMWGSKCQSKVWAEGEGMWGKFGTEKRE